LKVACLLARDIWHGSGLIRRSSEASKVIRNRGDYGQVKVYAGRDPLTGRERYEYDRARTKREAERVEAALKTNVAEGRHRSTAARTVADLVERWYQWRQGVKEISPPPWRATGARSTSASSLPWGASPSGGWT
jgi:hypothetical protein